jgi:hypothetical protein
MTTARVVTTILRFGSLRSQIVHWQDERSDVLSVYSSDDSCGRHGGRRHFLQKFDAHLREVKCPPTEPMKWTQNALYNRMESIAVLRSIHEFAHHKQFK